MSLWATPLADRLPRAAGLLDLTWPATAAEVRAAFRAKVQASGSAEGPGRDVNALQAARDELLAAVDQPVNDDGDQPSEKDCLMCGGTGRIGSGFGSVCSTCQGTGQTR